MRAVIDPRTERVLTEAGASIARVLDARQRHAVRLALEVCSYLVAALPLDEDLTFGDMVRLLRWFMRGFNKDAEDGYVGD
jgi:hypothetical protein